MDVPELIRANLDVYDEYFLTEGFWDSIKAKLLRGKDRLIASTLGAVNTPPGQRAYGRYAMRVITDNLFDGWHRYIGAKTKRNPTLQDVAEYLERVGFDKNFVDTTLKSMFPPPATPSAQPARDDRQGEFDFNQPKKVGPKAAQPAQAAEPAAKPETPIIRHAPQNVKDTIDALYSRNPNLLSKLAAYIRQQQEAA